MDFCSEPCEWDTTGLIQSALPVNGNENEIKYRGNVESGYLPSSTSAS